MPTVAPPPILRTNGYVHVDPADGSDSTGARDRLDLPFRNIIPALSASDPGDVVLLAPGTYNQAGTPVQIPDRVVLRGAGQRSSKVVFDGTISLAGDSTCCINGAYGDGEVSLVQELWILNPNNGGINSGPVGIVRTGVSSDSPEMYLENLFIQGDTDGIYLGPIAALIDAKHIHMDCSWDTLYNNAQGTLRVTDSVIDWHPMSGVPSTSCTGLYGATELRGVIFNLSGEKIGTLMEDMALGIYVATQGARFSNVQINNTTTGNAANGKGSADITFAASNYVKTTGWNLIDWGNRWRIPGVLSTPPSVVPQGTQWFAVDVLNHDCTEEATVQDIPVFDLPGGCVVLGAFLCRKGASQGFTGTGISAVTGSLGISGSPAKYLAATSVLGTDLTKAASSPLLYVESVAGFNNPTTVSLRLTTTGGNVSALAANAARITCNLLVGGVDH